MSVTKDFVEEECKRLAKELLDTGRINNPDELAYWMTYIAKRGYELGFVDSYKDRPFNPPSSKHVPKLYIDAPK